MFGKSTLVTVGLALDRAQTDGLTVRVAVADEWIRGTIVSSDGHGVVIAEGNGEVCVVRSEAITAVRLCLPAPDARISPLTPQVWPQPEAARASR